MNWSTWRKPSPVWGKLRKAPGQAHLFNPELHHRSVCATRIICVVPLGLSVPILLDRNLKLCGLPTEVVCFTMFNTFSALSVQTGELALSFQYCKGCDVFSLLMVETGVNRSKTHELRVKSHSAAINRNVNTSKQGSKMWRVLQQCFFNHGASSLPWSPPVNVNDGRVNKKKMYLVIY